MPDNEAARHEAERKEILREEARDIIREELDHLRAGEHPTPSVTDAVAKGILRAERAGAEADIADEEIVDTVESGARRVLADELADRGRRSAKKSRHTTQILRDAERKAGLEEDHGR